MLTRQRSSRVDGDRCVATGNDRRAYCGKLMAGSPQDVARCAAHTTTNDAARPSAPRAASTTPPCTSLALRLQGERVQSVTRRRRQCCADDNNVSQVICSDTIVVFRGELWERVNDASGRPCPSIQARCAHCRQSCLNGPMLRQTCYVFDLRFLSLLPSSFAGKQYLSETLTR